MNHDEAYNNGEEPEKQDLPWFNKNNGNETYSNGVTDYTDAFFGTIFDAVKSLEFAIGGVESFINSAEFLDEWFKGNYF